MTGFALIACCKSKLETAVHVPADKLYLGQLFQAQLAYARQTLALPDSQIFVLSANYCLLGIKWPALPYEKTLNEMSEIERRRWAETVSGGLYKRRLGPNGRVHMMAGKHYRESLSGLLHNLGFSVEVPHPQHLGYGQQVSWYRVQVSGELLKSPFGNDEEKGSVL